MTSTFSPVYMPQTDRIGLLHRGISLAMLATLMIFLSVFVPQLEPKLGVITMAVCLFFGGKRLLSPAIWPLIAIVAYNTILNITFPCSKPDVGVIIQQPIFVLDCVLLAALVLGGQSIRRQYLLLLGILFISLIGAIGDWTGHDMTALLPIELPDDSMMNVILMQQGDVVRIRGFFTEAGVLAAVSIGVTTILSIGALVLIELGVCTRYARVALASALTMGAAILCITVTKSGFVMVGSGLIGFDCVLLSSRHPRCRGMAAFILAGLVLGFAGFLMFGPSTLTNYLRGEIAAMINPHAMTPQDMAMHPGVITRTKCWLLAFDSLRLYPMGVGAYGLSAVIQRVGSAGMTHEMIHFFSKDIFGLKNALANLIAQTGLIGVSLFSYWMYVAFIAPIRALLADGSFRNTIIAGLYGGSGLLAVLFLFSCEVYPSMAFLMVLKCHADAVSQTILDKARQDVETVELIG